MALGLLTRQGEGMGNLGGSGLWGQGWAEGSLDRQGWGHSGLGTAWASAGAVYSWI